MNEQLDLFSDSYKTLNDLLEIVYKLNPTGGYYEENHKPIPPNYQIDYYRDLAFIVQFRDNENDNNEKIIDNAIYLKEVGEGLYSIYEIDGKILGQLAKDNMRHTEMVIALINYMVKGEVFKK